MVKEQKCILAVPQAGDPRPAVGSAGSSRGLSPWLADSHRLLPVSSHGYPCVMSVSKFLYSRIYKDAHQAGSESTLMTSFYLLLFLAVLGL